MKWWLATLLLCSFGCFKEFRPTEPYLYNYQHDDLNITDEDLNGKVYPLWTYTYLIALVPSLLLTDVLLYKSVLIFESACYIAVWLTLIFGRSVFSQQLGQVFFGFATATEVAYFAYIYVKVDRRHFSRVTAWTRSALLAGKCVSYLLSQFFVLFEWGSYQTLNYITTAALGVALVLSIALPNVSWKSVVNRRVEQQTSTRSTPTPPESIPSSYLEFVVDRVKDFKKQTTDIYTDWKLLKWSFWWAMASCGEFQIGNYTQTLWGQLQTGDDSDKLNGFIEAACPFVSMLVILAMEKVKINYDKYGELCLAGAAFVDFAVLLVMSQAERLWIMYAGYIFFRVAYQAMIFTAQFNIVCRVASNSFGFVFGVNTFIALGLQTLLTLVVVDDRVLGMHIRPQFVVYAWYHAAIGFVFVAVILGRVVKALVQKRRVTVFPDVEAEGVNSVYRDSHCAE